MGGSEKSKRVAWASDVNLCQVKLFLSDESPSQVGLEKQDHMQAKTLWPHQSGGMGLDDNLPPGFEGMQPASVWSVQLSQIPLVMWKSPPRFEVDNAWAVVSGEESTEIEAQNQREMRMLEAIYPRPSSIPPNPSSLASIEDSSIGNQNPPLIPITPIEDEENGQDTTVRSTVVSTDASLPQHLSHGTSSFHGVTANEILATGVGPDILAAAQAAALTSTIPFNDQGSLIDRELLIKILSNQKLVEQLLNNHGVSSSAQTTQSSSMPNMPASNISGMQVMRGQTSTSSTVQHIPPSHMSNVPSSSLESMPATGMHHFTSSMHNVSSDSVNMVTNRRDLLSAQLVRPELVSPLMATTSSPFNPPNRNLRPFLPDIIPTAPASAAPVVKDLNYYKNLVQQHGEERRENLPQFAHQINQPSGPSQETPNIVKSRDPKQKIMKPCIFFNSSRGCRNGANCPYQHEATIPEVPSAKRMKINREITGT